MFPDLTDGGYFYIRVSGCKSCCEIMKVVAKDGDVLTVERNFGTQCSCIHSNATVEYSLDNAFAYKDLTQYVPIKVTDPLTWNCETNTIGVDCSKLFSKDCGCDCEGPSEPSGNIGGGGTGGLRGERGEKGDRGDGIDIMVVSATNRLLVTLTNGKVIDAGALPQAKGLPGPPGERGEKGDPGPRGEDGARVTSARREGDNLFIDTSDGQSFNAGDITGPQGPKGDRGDKGEKGDPGRDGDVPYPQYVKANKKARFFGPANKQITIRYMTMDDADSLATSGVDMNILTDGKGNATLPPIPAGNFLEFYADGRLIGIGAS